MYVFVFALRALILHPKEQTHTQKKEGEKREETLMTHMSRKKEKVASIVANIKYILYLKRHTNTHIYIYP